jgi:phage tail-like protein
MPAAAPETSAPAPDAGQTGNWKDPYRSYNFKVSVQGVGDGHFTECSGLAVRVQSIPYREAGGGSVIHRLPGQIEYGEITLRYGLTNSKELWQWFLSAVEGKVNRRSVSIIMLADDGTTEVLRWDLRNAWVTEWRGALLDALGREAAIESMTLVCEELKRQP